MNNEERLQAAAREWDEAKSRRGRALRMLNGALDRGSLSDARWYRNALNQAIEDEQRAYEDLALLRQSTPPQ